MSGQVTVMYLISYNIEKDKVRNRIAKTLENYGKRVQYSVFECFLNEGKFNELYGRLVELMQDEQGGNIRIYKLCVNCERKLLTIGIEPEPFREKDVIVI